LAGWWCICRAWNGEEKEKRLACRVCGSPRVPTEGLTREQLIGCLSECTREMCVLRQVHTEVQTRCDELKEENRSLKEELCTVKSVAMP
jgi:hypothetical protein